MRFWAGIMLFTAAAAGAQPSFDCRKAATEVENLICKSSKLSSLDQELANTYKDMRQVGRPDSRQNLSETQRAWLKLRNQCRDEACLIKAYEFRLDSLCLYEITGAFRVC